MYTIYHSRAVDNFCLGILLLSLHRGCEGENPCQVWKLLYVYATSFLAIGKGTRSIFMHFNTSGLFLVATTAEAENYSNHTPHDHSNMLGVTKIHPLLLPLFIVLYVAF